VPVSARRLFVLEKRRVEGIKTARSVGVHPILMMNDPDEARRLAMHNPAGGVVSLHEMPDFIRLIAAQFERGVSESRKVGPPGSN
jgi:hypothetical protein